MEKSKNETSNKRFSSFRRYWLAYLAGMLFFISSAVYAFDLPGWYGLKTDSFIFAVVTLGIYALPAFILYNIADVMQFTRLDGIYLFPEPLTVGIFLLVMAGIAAGIVWCLIKLHRFRRFFRVVIGLSIALHALIAIGAMGITGRAFPPPAPPATVDCNQPVTDQLRVRLTVYTYRSGPTPASSSKQFQSFYALWHTDTDTGQYIAAIWGDMADCVVTFTGALDDSTFWVIHNATTPRLLTTHTGGRSWLVWSLTALQNQLARIDWAEVRDGKISAVSFDDQTNGTMTIAYYDYDTKTDTTLALKTTNGGILWKPAE